MRSVFLRLVLVVSFLCLTVSCKLENQDPGEVFDNGKLPQAVHQQINPIPSFAFVNSIPSANWLDIGVMDSGVDYTHPFLAPRIRYSTSGGKVTGAGHDFLGRDSWPHPNKMSASIFAFGGELTKDKKIANPGKDPIAKITELNDLFFTILDKKLKGHKTLSKTLLNKINKNNFHFLGAYTLVTQKYELLNGYKSYKDLDYFYGPTLEKSSKNLKTNVKKYSSAFTINNIFNKDWQLDASRGLPFGIALDQIDGFDVFLDEVEKAFQEFDSQSNFTTKYFQPYYDYRYEFFDSAKRRNEKSVNVVDLTNKIYAQWYGAFDQYSDADPMHLLTRWFCHSLDEKQLNYFNQKNLSIEKREQFVLDRFNDYQNLLIKQKKQYLKEALSSEKRQAESLIKAAPKYRALSLGVLKQRGLKNISCDGYDAMKRFNYPYKSDYARYGAKTKHPYLDASSSGNSHGSHVSGIVLSQSENLRVVPMKVLTESRETVAIHDKALAKKFKHGILKWLKTPLVRDAVKDLFEGRGFNLTQAQIDKKINDMFAELFESKKLDFYFMDQIVEAVEYAGKQKLKLVNISLGTDFSKHITPIKQGEDYTFLEILKFVNYEYFKYIVSMSVLTHAENTLFVVAAGNNGGWLDGKSRVGLPCDVSSPFLGRFRTESGKKYAEIPNNTLNNILCVGSIDRRDDLSSFTNILLTRVPFVVSYGETILSAAHTYDCQGVDQNINAEMGTLPYLDAYDKRFWRAELKNDKDFQKKSRSDQDEQLNKLQTRYASASSFMSQATEVAKKQKCVVHRTSSTAYMSGTSMASPAVAGYLGKKIQSEMVALGLDQIQAYDHTYFKPKVIIERILKSNPKFGGSSIIRDLRKIVKIENYQKIDQKLYGIPLGKGGVTVLVH